MSKNEYQQIMDVLLGMKEDVGRIEQKVDNVHEQATKTNGRVLALEAQVKTNTSFIENFKGKLAVVAIFIGIGTTIISAWIKKNLGL